jgi:hypothetical protein
VFRKPAKPAFEGSPLTVHREDIGSSIRQKGHLSETETKLGVELGHDSSALSFGYSCIGTTTVEAEDAMEMKRSVVDGRC